MSPLVLHFVKRAVGQWRRGGAALAHIELAFARLPRLASEADAFRHSVAETLLDGCVAPRDLARTLARHLGPPLAPAPTDGLAKYDIDQYDPGQPRVPAGSGRESGRWGTATGGAAVPSTPPAATEAFLAPAGGLAAALADASPAALQALAVFAQPLLRADGRARRADHADAQQRRRHAGHAARRCRRPLSARWPGRPAAARLDGPDGGEAVVVAHRRGGVYIDGTTGKPLGRDLGEQFCLDLAAVTAALACRGRPRPAAAVDGPQLCLELEVDKYGSDEVHVLDYEDDVHRRVNPLAPLPRGFAVPATGLSQYPDDCFRYAGDLVDGDMRAGNFADAKGEEYSLLLMQRFAASVMDRLVDVTMRHQRAAKACGARLKVYFAKQEAADKARKEFSRRKLGDVAIGVLPPSKPKRRR